MIVLPQKKYIKMMNILVTGSNGQLGSELKKIHEKRKFEVCAFDILLHRQYLLIASFVFAKFRVFLGVTTNSLFYDLLMLRIFFLCIYMSLKFGLYAGFKKRAPKWMCENSLEWLYRLLLEPQRLFSR